MNNTDMIDFYKKTLKDINIENKKVIVRFEYNVPLKKDDNDDIVVADDYRIIKSLPTLNYLLDKNCAVIILASLGRPKGKKDSELSLRPVADKLSEHIGKKVEFVDDCIGDKAYLAKKQVLPGEVILLENLRFYPGEESNDTDFAKNLASNADYFVQDAFGNSHREYASMSAITMFIPSVAGLLIEQEVRQLNSAINDSKRPRCAIIGGAKIKTKEALLERLINSVDMIIIGGAMANTFLVAQGHGVGASLYDADEVEDAKKVLEKINNTDNLDFFMPSGSFAVAKSTKKEAERVEKDLSQIDSGDIILDFGKDDILRMLDFMASAQTIIWNGQVGMTELDNFKLGSAAILYHMVNNKQIASIVGGGDTAGFIKDMGKIEDLTHVSTGGGASLQLISGKKLPAVEALLDK